MHVQAEFEEAEPDEPQDNKGPWSFVVPQFPVTLLMPYESVRDPHYCTPPTLIIPAGYKRTGQQQQAKQQYVPLAAGWCWNE